MQRITGLNWLFQGKYPGAATVFEAQSAFSPFRTPHALYTQYLQPLPYGLYMQPYRGNNFSFQFQSRLPRHHKILISKFIYFVSHMGGQKLAVKNTAWPCPNPFCIF